MSQHLAVLRSAGLVVTRSDGNTVYYSAQWGSRPMEIYALRLDSGTSLALGVRDGEIQAVSGDPFVVVCRPEVTKNVLCLDDGS